MTLVVDLSYPILPNGMFHVKHVVWPSEGFHVKHQMLQETLRTQLAALGLTVDTKAQDEALNHLLWVLETNERLNLTAVKNAEDAVRLHVVDSLAAQPELDVAPLGPVLDIGTGGGYPGLPLALSSRRPFTLLDSVAKKAAILRAYVSEEGLEGSIRVLAARSEELARQEPAAFSVVIARAVSALPSLLELASPLLPVGGQLIAMKGDPTEEELARGARAADILGFQRVSERSYVLPGCGEARTILVYEKRTDPQLQLPRREGLAQRKPLA